MSLAIILFLCCAALAQVAKAWSLVRPGRVQNPFAKKDVASQPET